MQECLQCEKIRSICPPCDAIVWLFLLIFSYQSTNLHVSLDDCISILTLCPDEISVPLYYRLKHLQCSVIFVLLAHVETEINTKIMFNLPI